MLGSIFGLRSRAHKHHAKAVGGHAPRLEELEQRVVLSGDLASALITVPSSVDEGQVYQIELSDDASITGWTIDWGDGMVEDFDADAAVAAHVYDDGTLDYTITVTAEAASTTLPDGGFFWSAGDGGNGHYYLLSSSESTWLDAEAEAVSLGGHLVSITSQEEQDFVVSTFLSGDDANNVYWIGINDSESEGTYVWSSGEAVTYTNFNPGEPNNFRGVEDYGTINWHLVNGRADGQLGDWNDAPNDGFNRWLNGPDLSFGIVEIESLPGGTTVESFQVTVHNVAPNASVDGSDSGVRGQELSFTFNASDASSADEAAGFVYSIDWDGDGVIDEVVEGGTTIEVAHTFVESGEYNVQVFATDKDDSDSTVASHTVGISAVELQVDPDDPTQTTLAVGGTSGDDSIRVASLGRSGRVGVWVNGQFLGTYSPTAGVEVYGGAGDDRIIAAGMRQSVILHGGEGDDLLIGGREGDVLEGGAGDDILLGLNGDDAILGNGGNDRIIAGRGNDLVIGGSGADHIVAEPGRDLLVSDEVSFEDSIDAVMALLSDWTDGDDNVDQWLNDSTVIDDGDRDRVIVSRRSGDAAVVSDNDATNGGNSRGRGRGR